MSTACILNSGAAAWAFEWLAGELSAALAVPVEQTPRQHNYVLSYDRLWEVRSSFIPLNAIEIASDKRLIAQAFAKGGVPAPETHLLATHDDVVRHIQKHSGEWCLKFPTSCGGAGHMLLTAESTVPSDWPRPYVVQRFIRMEVPRVYRTFVAGTAVVGWVTRRFPAGKKTSPWVAHARGAVYDVDSMPPASATDAAQSAFESTGLFGSFGCADLIQSDRGDWLVLEVGTDGLANHVDRDVGVAAFISELHHRIKGAFQNYVQAEPVQIGG